MRDLGERAECFPLCSFDIEAIEAAVINGMLLAIVYVEVVVRHPDLSVRKLTRTIGIGLDQFLIK